MSNADEEAFLARIRSDATDQARLVYADWLEERGEPLRAEYVRLEIQIHALDPSKAKHPSQFVFRHRFEVLAEDLDTQWIASVQRLPPGADPRDFKLPAAPPVAPRRPLPASVPLRTDDDPPPREPGPKRYYQCKRCGSHNIIDNDCKSCGWTPWPLRNYLLLIVLMIIAAAIAVKTGCVIEREGNGLITPG